MTSSQSRATGKRDRLLHRGQPSRRIGRLFVYRLNEVVLFPPTMLHRLDNLALYQLSNWRDKS